MQVNGRAMRTDDNDIISHICEVTILQMLPADSAEGGGYGTTKDTPQKPGYNLHTQ